MSEPAADGKNFADLWLQESDEAARYLFENYGERLMALARRRISPRLASRVDPEDILQSVFRTFFGRLKDGRFQIDNPDDLLKLLVRITIHKTLRQIAFHRAAKRDPQQEAAQSDQAQDQLLGVHGREPDPEVAITFVDQLDHLLGKLGPQERQILEMRLQGYSNDEIAEKLNIYDRKIRRVFERIRGLAEQEGLAPQ
jgi:RNA polymerase sigma-70 factor (ECF subfamily)